MKTVLITGATDFVGQHLVGANLKAGYKVEALVPPKHPAIAALAKQGVDVIIGSITNYRAVEHAVNGADIVYHLAGEVSERENREKYTDIHSLGTSNLCQACWKRGNERIISIHSSDVFGRNERVTLDETRPYSRWHHPYPDSGIEAAKITRSFAGKGLPVTTVYPCQVYGPGDTFFLPGLVRALIEKRWYFWRKHALIWPLFIENLTDFLLLVAHHPAARAEHFLIHDGQSDTMEHFVSQIAESLSLAAPTRYIPYVLALISAWLKEKLAHPENPATKPFLTVYRIKNLGSRRHFSMQKARTLLAWTPPIPYESGLTRTLSAFNMNEINSPDIQETIR